LEFSFNEKICYNNNYKMNQLYNKSILLSEPLLEDENSFNLCYLVYHGKLTKIAEQFNKQPIKDSEDLVSMDTETKTPLEIAGYLGFKNIFLYLLTFGADPYHIDNLGQNLWHCCCYRGEINILSLLLNYERFLYKMKSMDLIENIKKSYSFSKLDILNGGLSKAVNMTETNIKKFKSFQTKLREECENIVNLAIDRLAQSLIQKDKNGRTPLHYAAMSKFPLCYQVVNNILDYDFFSLDGWDDFLRQFEDIQTLEVKAERLYDPRRSLRLERELKNLLGDGISRELSNLFKKRKKALLKKIFEVGDNLGDSILHVASFHGDYRIVQKLLLYGADKTLRNDEGKMPVDLAKDNYVRKVLTNLNKAAKNSDEKNVTELVNFGHDINSKLSIFNQAPIHKIIESNKEEKYDVLKKMLDMGADPRIKDSNGWTALHYSCQFGDERAAEILVKSNINIDDYSNNHKTPLHMACSLNFPNIVKLLLENNANPNFKDHNGCTPLHLAAKHGNIECLALLLNNKADLYCEDFRKWNILHYAAFDGHHRAVRFIAKFDADFDILCTSRNSQNKLAIEIVRDPNVKPYFMSLWHSAKLGDLDVTRQLLNDGENINEQTVFLNNTPLHLAVLNCHYLLVRLLLENKAATDIRNRDGLSPADYAEAIYGVINKSASKVEDLNDVVDIRNFVRPVFNKADKILNATISEKNRKIKFWQVNDFVNKIHNLLVDGKN